MLILRLLHRLPIARNTSNSTPYRARNTVRDTGAEIVELTFCLFCFALSVLFLAGFFPILLKTLSVKCWVGEGWGDKPLNQQGLQ
jgi:hypothetical protein